MKFSYLATLSGMAGVVIAIFSGTAMARHAGFGSESWLMAAFALGIFFAQPRSSSAAATGSSRALGAFGC